MSAMFVTLEVSKLSGWLNTDARCRESKERHSVRGEVLAGIGGRVAGDRGARNGEGLTADWWQGARGSARRTSGSWL